MNTGLPTTIPAYLAHLRRALEGADPAMIQDALYDAEEYLRAELAANPGKCEAEVIADVAGSYGDPEEVADIYRDTEVKVRAALRTPNPPSKWLDGLSPWRRIFGVFTDPRSYGALFYMLLSLGTGIAYFTWTVTGMSLSAGLMILIVGLPLFVLFIGLSRLLALVEGRLVEALLDERMPRRPPYSDVGMPLLKRIGAMFTDPRTWGTFFYFLLMLPLGIAYFVVALTGLSVSLGLMFGPPARLLGFPLKIDVAGSQDLIGQYPFAAPLVMLAGFLLLTLALHVARGIGRLHGMLAKQLLVKV
ncbi:hypothetical protein EBB59_06885 [Lysobacter pythonis]|uniref:Putative sensor domain-containing protein n=1 Tax=Solilutibacter pythonis TaxID=2483112 RepID=A0A3M2I374_9GAMM|nr:sensor domain-containing protein [Lysobacter pythonis]RMH92947.1 hypothetical protein EBB59_06885 [Lysobacter pythonis]